MKKLTRRERSLITGRVKKAIAEHERNSWVTVTIGEQPLARVSLYELRLFNKTVEANGTIKIALHSFQ